MFVLNKASLSLVHLFTNLSRRQHTFLHHKILVLHQSTLTAHGFLNTIKLFTMIESTLLIQTFITKRS